MGESCITPEKDLERMKQLTNQMCRERGLTVAEKGKHFDGSQIEKGEVVAWSKDKYNLFRQQVKDSFVADCAMAVLKALGNCISKEMFIEKNETVWMECKLDREKEAHYFSEPGWEEGARQQFVKNIPSGHQQGGLENEFNGNYERVRAEAERTNGADEERLPDTTDKWKQLVKEQAASLELVTEERDELQVRNQKMNEFIQKFQERTHKLKMEKQKLFFENHEMQDEIRKLNDEIHRLTTELSETQKLNQLLQQSNDDLRNRNGLKSRREQEQLEEEIKDVRDQNSKLQIGFFSMLMITAGILGLCIPLFGAGVGII